MVYNDQPDKIPENIILSFLEEEQRDILLKNYSNSYQDESEAEKEEQKDEGHDLKNLIFKLPKHYEPAR